MDRPLVAGRVGRPHGLDGSFHVVQPRPGLLAAARLTVRGRRTAVVRRAGTDQRPILRLEGYAGRDAAEGLRGEPLLAEPAAAPPLEEDEWYAEELEGCAVVAGERELGRVSRVLAYPSCELLEVGELLVPLVRDAVREVDTERRRIEVDAKFLGL